MTKRALVAFGTRPEAIKLAPVVQALAQSDAFETRVCVTAQHRQMLDQALDLFGIAPDVDLNLMRDNQDLSDLTSNVLLGMRDVYRQLKPDIVLVQGDTTTCFAASLAAFYERVAVGHVEAGLRTYNLGAPFPEEGNRALVSRIAQFHYAPTERAKANLVAELVPAASVIVTGNTVIDALLHVRHRVSVEACDSLIESLGLEAFTRIHDHTGPVILMTSHRRENFGRGFDSVFRAVAELATRHADWLFAFPVHLNPNVSSVATRLLGQLRNVILIKPADYRTFVWLMDRATVILTDSGGVQEEAPSLGKPVLVMRDITERPEGVDAGTVKLVGTDRKRIVSELERLVLDPAAYEAMSRRKNPYGDGQAAKRIVAHLEDVLGRSEEARKGTRTARHTSLN
jgi:UDP-N-acetylglucosamine 2-epimerase (non-hydrolysing)